MRRGGLLYISTKQSRRWTPERYVWGIPVNLGSAVRGLPCDPAGVTGSALAHTSESGLCCTRLTVRPCWGDGLGTRPPSLYLSRPTNEGPSWCALAIDPVWGIARRTDHRLPTALSDDGLGDDPPRCPHRRHLYSKLGFTTAAFLPLIIAPMGNLV